MTTRKLDSPPRAGVGSLPAAWSVISTVRPQVRTMVRQWLFFYFLLVLFEGVLRRWLLPQLNEIIYIAKDAVLAFLCLRLVLTFGHIPMPDVLRRSNVGQLFVAFAIYSFVEGFNPRLPNTILGLWGIRTYVLPMSLVYLIPLGMPNPRANERYFRWYLLFGIPIAALCIVQYRLPATHWLNQYSNTDEAGEAVAMVAGAVRVTGTFSYISGMTIYAAFLAAGLLGVLFAARWKVRGNRLMWLALVLTVAVVPMTGSRALAMYLLLYIGIVGALGQMVLRGSGASSRMIIATICVAAISIGLFGEAFDNLAWRARTSGDTASRFEKLVFQPFKFVEYSGLFGYGAAATHQAAPALVPGGRSYYWLPRIGFEEEAGRVMLELGGIGFILYMALKIGVCWMVFNYIRRFGRAVPLAIPVACLLTATSCMVTGMLFSSVGSSFYWGVFGLFVAQANATRVVANPK